ncbi:MAG: glycerol-3-phosphate 1-O-acyltransferase PlsY [Gemmatimonadaceae bacterium]
MHPVVALVLAYLLGSVPTAYAAGKLFGGIDLREHGSRNLGATNVYRVLGWRVALLVLAVDIGKGALPAALFPRWVSAPNPELWAIAFGLAAILGHVRSIFLLLRGGGKGVATAAGVFLALAPLPTLIALAVFLVVVLGTGYVSAASLSAAITLPIAVLAERGPRSALFAVSLAVGAFVFWTHRANIGRLRRGEESRFGRKPSA